MSDADTGYFRSISIAGFFIVLCIMLIFAAILGPAKRISFTPLKRNSGAPDLELGDLELESQRDSVRDPVPRGERDKYMDHPEQYDIPANPWENKSPGSLVVPERAHLPVLGGSSRGLNPEPGITQRGLGLPDPDIFNIPASHVEDPFADPIPEPAPVRPSMISFRTLTSLGPRFLQWKAQVLGDGKEDKGEQARDIEITPAATADGVVPDLSALSAAAAPGMRPTMPDEPFPEWLIRPKASAGPRAARFFEVDVDGPTISPPDHEFVAMQHEMLMRVPIPMRPGMPRSSTWHPSPDPNEGAFRPAVARNQTSAI